MKLHYFNILYINRCKFNEVRAMLNINLNDLKLFIKEKIGTGLDKREAQNLGLEKEFAEADVDANELEIEDILLDADLVAKFAVIQKTEEDKKQEAKDKEIEKEEQTKVQDKNEAGM